MDVTHVTFTSRSSLLAIDLWSSRSRMDKSARGERFEIDINENHDFLLGSFALWLWALPSWNLSALLLSESFEFR